MISPPEENQPSSWFRPKEAYPLKIIVQKCLQYVCSSQKTQKGVIAKKL